MDLTANYIWLQFCQINRKSPHSVMFNLLFYVIYLFILLIGLQRH